MKQSAGFTRLTPSIITIVAMMASFWVTAIAMRSIPSVQPTLFGRVSGAIGALIVGIVFCSKRKIPMLN